MAENKQYNHDRNCEQNSSWKVLKKQEQELNYNLQDSINLSCRFFCGK